MALKSWIAAANDPHSDFPLVNLPYGLFTHANSTRIGIGIGDQIFDLRAAASESGWVLWRLTSFNSLLLAPAAAVRIAQRWRTSTDYKSDLELGPAWLNSALERPLALEAGWLSRGRTLPAGLSLLALLRKPEPTA